MITRAQYVHVSASQISTWRGCMRKWAYQRLRPKVKNEWAEFGDRVHKILENWLQFGIVPDLNTREGACAFAGLHYLPMPPQVGVERTFEFMFGGVVYTGRIDLLYGYRPQVSVCVEDHKSTGDLKWAKTTEQLQDDPQWITYGTFVAESLDVPLVVGQWVWYERPTASKPARSMDVAIAESRETLRARFAVQHHLHVIPLATSRACMPADNVQREWWIDSHPRVPNAGHRDSECAKYKGCEFRCECLGAMSPLDRMTAALAA